MLLVVQGLIGLAVPDVFAGVVRFMQTSPAIYAAEAVRVAVAIVLLRTASTSRLPIFSPHPRRSPYTPLSAGSLPKSFFIGGPRTVPRWRACSRQFPLRSVLSLRTGEPQKVIHQLRIYEIFDANKKPFHDRFRDDAMRIMAKYDFKIVATWESKKDNRTEFVYLLEWPDKETMTDRWKKILQDQEWIKINKETGDISGPFVGKIQDLTLYLTDYSPRQVLAK